MRTTTASEAHSERFGCVNDTKVHALTLPGLFSCAVLLTFASLPMSAATLALLAIRSDAEVLTRINIQNLDPKAVAVNLRLHASNGALSGSQSIQLPPRGSITIDADRVVRPGLPFVGWARIEHDGLVWAEAQIIPRSGGRSTTVVALAPSQARQVSSLKIEEGTSTILAVANASPDATSGTIVIFDESGAAQGRTSFSATGFGVTTIGIKDVFRIDSLRRGLVEVNSTAPVGVASIEPQSSIIDAALPLNTLTRSTSLSLPLWGVSGPLDATMIVVLNPSDDVADTTLKLWGPNGESLGVQGRFQTGKTVARYSLRELMNAAEDGVPR